MKPLIFYRMKDLFLNIGTKWDELSPSKENAIAFAHEFINPEPQKYVPGNNMKYTPEYVLAHHGQLFNTIFREGRDEGDEDCTYLTDMLDAHATKKDMVVYRGICGYVFEHMKENAKNLKGVDLLDNAFLQSSLVKGHESRTKIRLRIFVPKGTKAVYMGNVNEEQWYYEVTIQRGTPLRVVSVDKEYINCEVIL